MSAEIDVEFESFCLDQPRLLLHANQLIPVYVADKVQRQMQIGVGYTPSRALDKYGLASVV